MIPLAAFAIAPCLALSPWADHIRAGDLARALPEWSSVPPDTPLLLAPIPGAQRVLHPGDLRRLALRWNVAAGAEREICLAMPAAVPDAARMLAAMQRQLPAARIEILESSRQPVPSGELEFPLSGLHAGASAACWNGYVAYGNGRRFAIWARIKIAIATERVVAAQEIKQGVPIEAAMLRVETQDAPPGGATLVGDIAAAAGKLPRRTIAAGSAIRPEWLEAPKEVRRGETVQVDVFQGAAHLSLEGVAQASGGIGDTILIENPASGRRFPARVQAKGKVSVVKGLL